MKVLIVGGVAGGATTAARLRRLNEQAEIIIFERGKDISFANCGIPYYCGDVITDRDKLKVLTPESIKDLLNVEARVESEVLSIDRKNKTVNVLDKKTNTQYTENYDKLVLSPGAPPLVPAIEGINNDRVFTVRNLDDADKIKNFIQTNDAKTAAIIGAGFIGIEMAENLAHLGLDISIVELSNQVLNQIDYEMAAQVQNHLTSKGISLVLNNGVKAFQNGDKIVIQLNNGKELTVDFAILSLGVRPENKLAKEAGLEIGKTGGILVNKHLQTSDSDIYALGDAVEVIDFITKQESLIPLAGPANKQGRIIAENICGINTTYEATQGTAILKVFDLTVASTGSNEKQLTKNNIPYLKSYISDFSHAQYYPAAFPLTIKLLFTPDTGTVLGAQIVGLEGVDKRIDVLATAIKFGKTVRDLVELELAYAPPFGSAKDPVNLAGMAAENLLTDKVKPVYWNEIDKLSENTFILDVRTQAERILGLIENSYHIPLEQLRNRIKEIPQNKNIVVYCSKGLKSYLAARILLQNGFKKVYTLNGGYSLYNQVIQSKLNTLKHNKQKDINKSMNNDNSKYIKIDASGLQCPGPIMKLSKTLEKIQEDEIIEIKTTDPGFKNDVQSWCKSTGNSVLEIKEENKIITAYIKKEVNTENSQTSTSEKNQKTLVVFSNDLDKALASFIIANGAASTGKQVTLFFTFWGLNILRKSKIHKVKKSLLDKIFGFMMPQGAEKLILSKMNMLGLGTQMMKYVMKNKNVSTLQELIQQAQNNGVRFVACQMSMDVMGLKPEELIDGIEIAGVASYIDSAENSDLNLFI